MVLEPLTGKRRVSLSEKQVYILSLWVLSVAISMVFLNRWVVTDLGLQSFGRLWQYYVSYFDFGFIRRGLFGTIITETGVSGYFENPYVFGYFIYAAKIFILSLLVLFFCLKNYVFSSWHGYAVVFLSPAFILQSGYLTGTQDLQLIVLATTCVLFINNWLLISIFSALGVLMHELFVFMFPAIALVTYFKRVGSVAVDFNEIFRAFLSGALVIFALISVTFLGVDVERGQFESLMAERMGSAAHQHSLWSGYFEVFSSVDENAHIGLRALGNILGSLNYAIVPILYAVILAFAVSFYVKGEVWKKVLIFFALILPVFTILVASDFYRWVGMSANVSLLALLAMHNSKIVAVPNKIFIILLAFSFLAPFGAAGLERPFPAHQMVLEKIL